MLVKTEKTKPIYKKKENRIHDGECKKIIQFLCVHGKNRANKRNDFYFIE